MIHKTMICVGCALVAWPSMAQEAASGNERVVQPEPGPTDCETPQWAFDNPNAFALYCLGLENRGDYQTTDLAGRVTGNSEAGEVAISLPFTWRRRSGNGFARSEYIRIQPEVRAVLGSGDSSASFGDLSKMNLQSGAGLGLNFEIGWNRDLDDPLGGVRSAIARAMRDCIAYAEAERERRRRVGEPVRSAGDPQDDLSCSGNSLRTFMSDKSRRTDYYRSIVRPLWGYDADVGTFIGANASIGYSEYEYFPLEDPANTGIDLITELPGDFPEGASEQDETLYSVGVYVGRGFAFGDNVDGAISGSLTYRRDFDWARSTEDQQICPTGSEDDPPQFLRCSEVNIAPPFELEGLVIGSRLQAGFDNALNLPLAIEVQATYALEEEQFGLRVPVYFVTGDSGGLTGGLVWSYRSSGETSGGYTLKSENTLGLFVGTKFRIGGR